MLFIMTALTNIKNINKETVNQMEVLFNMRIKNNKQIYIHVIENQDCKYILFNII